ncbi:MAG: MarR family transcriptional regulator [Chloroflexi bacterium]|nr:MarR family transcriptional regulator [Chloroflexota bacterium]
MAHEEQARIAKKMLEIIPLVMRVMSLEMRSTGHIFAAGHVPLLGMLNHRTYTLGELAERHSVSSPTMSNTITALEERGWVLRKRSLEDRRVVWIEITSQGRTVLDDINRHVEKRIAGLLDELSEQQETALIEGLTVLRDVFATALERDPTLRHE